MKQSKVSMPWLGLHCTLLIKSIKLSLKNFTAMLLIFGEDLFSNEAAEKYLCLITHGASCLAHKTIKVSLKT